MININKIEKSVLLEKLQFNVSQMVPGHTLATTKLDIIKNNTINALVFQLRAEVMAEKLEDRTQMITFKVPKSWWQHFKQEKFPKWLLRKFPVKLSLCVKFVTFKHYATYPELPLVFPKDKIGEIVYKDVVTTKEFLETVEYRGQIETIKLRLSDCEDLIKRDSKVIEKVLIMFALDSSYDRGAIC